jgi:LCP family protein required for cell wall assembly
MGRDEVNPTFDFDNDPEFSEKFYKNIELAFRDTVAVQEPEERLDSDFIIQDTIAMNYAVDYYDDTEANSQTAAAQETLLYQELNEEDIEDELFDIRNSLARKICEEMDSIGAEEADQEQREKKCYRIRNGIVLALLCLVGFTFFFGFTKPGNKLLMAMGLNISGRIWSSVTGNFDDGTDVTEDVDYIDEADMASDAKEIDPNSIVWPAHPGEGRQEEGVYNILLLGEEAIGSGTARGRTDVIVVATMNTNTKKLRLTSLMRDTYVQIPGYQDNKLNSAYEKGGLDLLYETIALNFDLHLDGCVMVNFENFEQIIDKIGGLEIELTAGEAKYLNTTNYISNPAYRNVVAGKQLLNGNQVLGYTRVRKRATITGNNNDYGRTDRHRIVLNAIFDKYKSKSKMELATMMFDLLPMITTDIDNKNFEVLLNSFIEMGTMEMQQLRIPADGAFDTAKVRGMDCIIPDLQKNITILHDFIFDDKSSTTAGGTTDTNSTTSNTQ